MKTIGQSNNMTSQRPTTPGWYWYQLPGSWQLQPVLVFDSGTDGLMYTLESISVGESDDERDGFFLDDAAPEALWSQENILPSFMKKEPRPVLQGNYAKITDEQAHAILMNMTNVIGMRDAEYFDSTPLLHVGSSSFEDWFQAHEKACTGDKQLARDAYAAGMGDPLVTYASSVDASTCGKSKPMVSLHKNSDGEKA